MATYITIVISAISVSFAIYMGFKSIRKEDDKAIADKVARDTKINIKLDDISGDVKEIRYDFSETKKQVADMDKRLVVVEQSAKAAHHRLDDFIGKADRADAE